MHRSNNVQIWINCHSHIQCHIYSSMNIKRQRQQACESFDTISIRPQIAWRLIMKCLNDLLNDTSSTKKRMTE